MTPLKQCANHQFRENTTNRRPFSLVSNALSLAATSSTNRVSQSVSHCHHCKRISDICSSQPERRSVTKNTHTHATPICRMNCMLLWIFAAEPSRRRERERTFSTTKTASPGRRFRGAIPRFFSHAGTDTNGRRKQRRFFFLLFSREIAWKKKTLSATFHLCYSPTVTGPRLSSKSAGVIASRPPAPSRVGRYPCEPRRGTHPQLLLFPNGWRVVVGIYE